VSKRSAVFARSSIKNIKWKAGFGRKLILILSGLLKSVAIEVSDTVVACRFEGSGHEPMLGPSEVFARQWLAAGKSVEQLRNNKE
jgi:hypothetical protein